MNQHRMQARKLCQILFLSAAAAGSGLYPEGPIAGQEPPAQTTPPSAPAAGALPWEARPRTNEPILRPPADAGEVLARYDLSDSQLAGFFNGQALGPSEEDVIIKILYRFPRLGLDNIARWRRTDVTLDQLAAAPVDYRTDFIPLRGRVTRVTKVDLLPEQAELYEFSTYFRVTLDIADSPYQALICTRRVPQAWKVDEPIDEQATADGMFLKVGDSMAADPQLIFAAGRVAWLPDKPAPAQHIGPDQLQLAKLGVDLGLFDDVRQSNGRALGDVDREAFYQLLHALGQPSAATLKPSRPAPLDVVPLLEKPGEHHGQIMRVRGTARRIMRVPVRDLDIQRRFGIDHYYEIDFFVSLGDKRLQMGKDPKGEKNLVYTNEFPATLIVRRLPEGLAEGAKLAETVETNAVFFKVWSYRSGYTDKFAKAQLAPMFLATEPELIVPPRPANSLVSALILTALGLAVGISVLMAWWFHRSDNAYRAAMKQAHAATDAQPPDFSKFAE